MSGLVDLDGEGGGGGPATVGGARIVFVLTAYLSVPEIEVRPSIDEVQGEGRKKKDGFNKWGELSLVDITSLTSLIRFSLAPVQKQEEDQDDGGHRISPPSPLFRPTLGPLDRRRRRRR